MRFIKCMKNTATSLVFVGCIFLVEAPLVRAQGPGSASNATKWPTHGWAKGTPASVRLHEKPLSELDSIFAARKAWPDAFAVFRCGTEVFERTYSRDFGAMYANEAKTRGPHNPHLRVCRFDFSALTNVKRQELCPLFAK
jgi:hypothetical protein